MNYLGIICVSFIIFPSIVLSASNKTVFCYFASWTVYRAGDGKFDVSNVDPSLCTHIAFAFIGLTDAGSVSILDPWESNDDGGYHGFKNIVALKEKNPNLKVLVSMGGYNEGSQRFSKVAENVSKRKALAADVLRFIKEWNFDGFDIYWAYPGHGDGSNPRIDKVTFTYLLQELKETLTPEGYLLTAAVAGTPSTLNTSYQISAISKIVDQLNVLSFDYHGSFDPYVGHVAPLYPSHLDQGTAVTTNVATTIQAYLNEGADSTKINLGIPTYGRSFTLSDKSNTSLYAPISGPGLPGPLTAQAGFLGYNEICRDYSSWDSYWDDEQKATHIVHDNQWVGYEDVKSIQYKVEFAKSKNLGGIMVWSLDTDDFRGVCGSKYPLLNAVIENLK
uniref:Chitinase 1 n=1 Tax=Chrysomela tremula TaxID=63687 RepID=C3UTC0_CHRTR|nr:chitinase 1 [Chrysomela tremula]